MDFLNKFKSTANGETTTYYKTVDHLVVNKPYKVLDFNFIMTTFGRRILMNLETKGDIILPGRISNIVATKAQLELLKEGVDFAMYLGKQQEGNGILLDFQLKNDGTHTKKSLFQ